MEISVIQGCIQNFLKFPYIHMCMHLHNYASVVVEPIYVALLLQMASNAVEPQRCTKAALYNGCLGLLCGLCLSMPHTECITLHFESQWMALPVFDSPTAPISPNFPSSLPPPIDAICDITGV